MNAGCQSIKSSLKERGWRVYKKLGTVSRHPLTNFVNLNLILL